MIFSILTIFPEFFNSFCQTGLISKALNNQLISIFVFNLRQFTHDKHQKVDDRPYGGGAGMVMKAEPLVSGVKFIQKEKPGRVILFSAYAKPLNQEKIKQLSLENHLILICGRYEGVDQRVIDLVVDEEISIGDYVLMGGEVAAQVIIETVSRMIPGVIGNPESVQTDSFFQQEQFGFPQYTNPREFAGLKVPNVLLTGNHLQIEKWRQDHQKKRTID
jgi:tRNA (guanine37-N1)-methyltransferase